jgi:RNA polymerase sigma factor (TIGR02999 family)
MRIVAGQDQSWQNRVHFFAVAARIMRHFLVDYAKARLADKRGGGAKKISLEPELIADNVSFLEIVELDRAIDKYAKIDARGARVVELRFFAGMGVEETANVLGVAERTVKRDWQTARVWLFNELKASP